MMSETFGWEEGLNKNFIRAGFYLAMIVSLVIGLLMNFAGISPVQGLIFAAVLYGLTAPVLIGLILHICNQKSIMGKYTNGKWSNLFGLLTFVLMTVSALVLVYYQFFD